MASNTPQQPTPPPPPPAAGTPPGAVEQFQPNEKPVYVWGKPVAEAQPQTGSLSSSAASPADGRPQGEQGAGTSVANDRPSITDAVGTIKKEDFLNVAQMPCARQGLITGIASGAAFGGVHYVVRGSMPKAANWAVGLFLLGSTASYEYCQYQRRSERLQMKRNIEIVTEKRREADQRKVEEQAERIRAERERRATERPWYKFW